MGLIIRLLLNGLSIFLAAYVIAGMSVAGWQGALITAIVFGIMNTLVRPVLLLLTLPVNILTLGLFTLVVNGATLLLTSKLIDSLTIDGLWPAILGSLLISFFNWLFGANEHKRKSSK